MFINDLKDITVDDGFVEVSPEVLCTFGEYDRTNYLIALKQHQLMLLKEQQKYLMECMYDLELEIGECEGYLIELDSLDNSERY